VTVTESANALFSTVARRSNGTVTIDADGATVAFTNPGSPVARRGKASDVDATFHSTSTAPAALRHDADHHDVRARAPRTSTASRPGRRARSPSRATAVSSVVTPGDGNRDDRRRRQHRVVHQHPAARHPPRHESPLTSTARSTSRWDCDDNAYDTTLTITTSGGSGSAHVDGIPTGVTCTVHEQSDPHYTTQSSRRAAPSPSTPVTTRCVHNTRIPAASTSPSPRTSTARSTSPSTARTTRTDVATSRSPRQAARLRAHRRHPDRRRVHGHEQADPHWTVDVVRRTAPLPSAPRTTRSRSPTPASRATSRSTRP